MKLELGTSEGATLRIPSPVRNKQCRFDDEQLFAGCLEEFSEPGAVCIDTLFPANAARVQGAPLSVITNLGRQEAPRGATKVARGADVQRKEPPRPPRVVTKVPSRLPSRVSRRKVRAPVPAPTDSAEPGTPHTAEPDTPLSSTVLRKVARASRLGFGKRPLSRTKSRLVSDGPLLRTPPPRMCYRIVCAMVVAIVVVLAVLVVDLIRFFNAALLFVRLIHGENLLT